jgi:hypothetical protein
MHTTAFLLAGSFRFKRRAALPCTQRKQTDDFSDFSDMICKHVNVARSSNKQVMFAPFKQTYSAYLWMASGSKFSGLLASFGYIPRLFLQASNVRFFDSLTLGL